MSTNADALDGVSEPETGPPPGGSVTLWLCLAAVFVLFGALYLPVLRDLAEVWSSDSNYSHGFLIPLFAGFYVWSRRRRIARLPVEPSLWGALLLLAGLLLLVLGVAVEAVGSGRGGLFVKGVSLIVALSGLVLQLLGRGYLGKLTFPLGYLLFMIPLPVGLFAMLTFPLQLHATHVTTSVLQLLGVSALREGNLIQLPTVTLGIAEACSGIRSIVTLLAGAVALSALTLDRGWQRLFLVGSVVPIAVLTNSLRVIGTGLLAHRFGEEVAQGFFHDFSGWVVLLLASVLLCSEALIFDKLATDS